MDGKLLQSIEKVRECRNLPNYVENCMDYFVSVKIEDKEYAVFELTKTQVTMRKVDDDGTMMDMSDTEQYIFFPYSKEWTTIIDQIADEWNMPHVIID